MAPDSTTTATVYQLYRGNHREDPDEMAAEDIRFEIRGDGRDAIAEPELARLYDEVAEETFSYDDPNKILPRVWARWNRGSGEESRTFLNAETRSLEVGDVVVIDGDHYLVEPFGWEEFDPRTAADAIEATA